MSQKKLRTIKENVNGKNLKSIDKEKLIKKENQELIKKVEKGDLKDYHVVRPKKGNKFLRSNPDRKKKNNLDPLWDENR